MEIQKHIIVLPRYCAIFVKLYVLGAHILARACQNNYCPIFAEGMNPQTSVEIGPFGIDDQVSCMHAIAAICPVECDFRTAAARFTDARLSRGTSADHRFTALYNLHHSARCVDVKPISVHTNTSCWSLRHSLQLAGHVYYIGTPTVLGITDPKFKTAKPRIVPGR